MQIAKTHIGAVNKGHVVGITNYQKKKQVRKEETKHAYNDYIIECMMQLNRHRRMPQILFD